MAGRSRIPRRDRYFVACEGDSEQGYTSLIQRYLNQAQRHVHLDAQIIGKAGDPLSLVERAIAKAEMGERGGKPRYVRRFLILDTDWIGRNADRDARAKRMAEQADLTLVKQDCCFEAFLLRHFDGHENDRPQTAELSIRMLKELWPAYRKGLSAQELARRISIEKVREVASRQMDEDFVVLLRAVGLIQ